MRGPLRWARNCGAQNCGEAPSPSPRSSRGSTSPRTRGEVKKRSRSRAHSRPSVVKQRCPKPSLRGAERRSNPERSGRTGFEKPLIGRPFRADPLARNDENKRKEAERRQTQYSMTCTQAAHRARHGEGGLRRPSALGRARLPAFHHGTCGSDRTPPLSSSSRTSWDGTREERVLPTPGRPSTAGDIARRPVVVPAGRFGPEPPGSGADNPARGNRTRPSPPASPGGVLAGEMIGDVTIKGTNVKRWSRQ